MIQYTGHCANIKKTTGQIRNKDIIEIMRTKNIETIQLFRPITLEEAALLNELFIKQPNKKLHIWCLDVSAPADLDYLENLTALGYLSILGHDIEVKNIKILEQLQCLSTLKLCQLKNVDYAFLKHLTKRLVSLHLELPKRKTKIDYRWLQSYPQLEKLSIQGNKRDIEQLQYLDRIKSLTLRGITIDSYEFIHQMTSLEKLSIRLGASKDFSALKNHANIKVLEFWCVQKLSDLSFVSSMKNLEWLYLHELPHVEKMPDMSELYHLKTIMIDSLKNLNDFSALKHAPALLEYIEGGNQYVSIDARLPIFENKQVETIYCRPLANKDDEKFAMYLQKYAKKLNEHHPIMPKWAI
ncbi:leucine-rich repeat domain-containing protein [Isobaculum melis]|uniref:Internalin A n=1 Tax=Isobaculum melis TaxID=142588 RepID=A0A1H9S175_9LACT|nr:hypothetical protein [Isobaculum melis]SER78761.1 hypothetical protein SAMN04488559_10634 [Isobaculum melis]